MTSFWLAVVVFGECLHQILDDSCNKTKSLTFLINNVKIWHKRAITLFVQQEQLPWISSAVYYFIIPLITLESAITSKISHFILFNSHLHCWYLFLGWELDFSPLFTWSVFDYTFFIYPGAIYTLCYFPISSNVQYESRKQYFIIPTQICSCFKD